MELARLTAALAPPIRTLGDTIAGTDGGTDEACMAWPFDETDRAVGQPWLLGGTKLSEIRDTGHGLTLRAAR